MIKKEDVIKIGQFAKPHGIKGEISLPFTNDAFDRCDSDYLVCEMDGILVPFFIKEYRFKSESTALIKFEDVDTEDAAKRFSNLEVYYPKAYLDEEGPQEDYTWSYFIGFSVLDESAGNLGKVVNVDESTLNVLLQIDQDGKELLVPAAEELITGIDHNAGILYVQLPEGLLNLDNMTDVY